MQVQRCIGWSNQTLNFNPQIISLSGYYSPAGSTTLVSINGNNFFSYSIVKFGTYNPTTYFINSNLIQFYVPNTITSGTYPIYVVNGSIYSNAVNYTVDNAAGYWLIEPSGYIINTNLNSGINPGFLSRNSPLNIISGAYTIQPTDNWIKCNNIAGTTLTLPVASNNNGREIMIKTVNGGVIASNFDIQPYDDIGGATTVILDGFTIPQWCTIVSNGTLWEIMQKG